MFGFSHALKYARFPRHRPPSTLGKALRFHLGNPFPSIETRSAPVCLGSLPSRIIRISEIPFLYFCVPNLIFSEPNVSRDESGDGIGQVRFSGCAERRCASS